MVKIEQFLVGEMDNFTYLIIDEKNKKAIIVDPSWNLDNIFEYLEKNKLVNTLIINTHSHFDHVLGNDQVVKMTGAKIIQHKASPLKKDIEVDDGESIKFGDVQIKVIHTPGHCPDSICLIIDDKIILTGDTLFVGSCGRIDLPGSDPDEMYYTIYNKLVNLDENLIVYPGHHYGSTKTSILKNEKKSNFVFKFHNREEFLRYMNT
ncbi:MAG TPA: MBL fold metallo-hydrolase [Candidatus Sulfopaludibacter sp.]|jgi:hydroxyacylglutathione hydrolase|nr:MBL fold metallo-hydrolase [Candidatus Sulfopaludibacter sp.]